MGRHLPFCLPSWNGAEDAGLAAPSLMNSTLTTDRLTLSPLDPDDAATVQRLCGNLAVARMLAAVPHPYPDGLAETWIDGHAAQRAKGTDYIFGIRLGGDLIGVIAIEQRATLDGFELGYWLGEPWWGQGLATEAVQRVVAFARDDLALERLISGCFEDNPASGRVLEKCGFRYDGDVTMWSEARGCEVPSRRLVWHRDEAEAEETRQ